MEEKTIKISLKTGIILSVLVFLLAIIVLIIGFYKLKNNNIIGRTTSFKKEYR